ncbi:MAG: CAP domain-containing protein [Fimbriimonadaceae bacterium]|nr:CAP domain-containing protein [Fimbriimonadaceae bacterium]
MPLLAWLAATVLAFGPRSGPAPETVHPFEFAAAQGRLDTGLWVERGESIEVKASGAWTMWAGHYGKSDANGHRFRVGVHSWGRLMGQLGSGQPVAIGTQRQWLASESGQLVLFPHTGAYGLRGGDGALKIEVIGGRPVSEVLSKLAAEGTQVTLPAGSNGLITDLYASPDEVIQIDAFGWWTMFDGGPLWTADGDINRLVGNSIPWGRLVARFGGPTFSLSEDYAIGQSRAIRSGLGGILALFPQTAEFAGHVRSGELQVVVRGGRPATAADRLRSLQQTTDRERSIAFLRLHKLRHSLSLPAAWCSPELMRAAQAHAEYLAARGQESHAEQPGEAGFSAATPAERAKAAGFDGSAVTELIHGYTEGQRAIDGLWATVYHRMPLLDPAATAIGIGIAGGKAPVCVVLSGVPATQRPDITKVPELATYPQDQQVQIPTTWNGLEEPSALAADAARPVGYPISATLTTTNIQKVLVARLADLDGVEVPCHLLAPGSDPQQMLRASAFLVPREPLKRQETYQVMVRLAGEQGVFTKQWRFTTGYGSTPLAGDAQLGNPSNPAIVLGR